MSLPFWFLWIIGALATYRLAFMTTTDTGPFEIFTSIRSMVGERFGYQSWQWEGANCPLCQGVWFSCLFALLLFPWMGIAAQFALWLSMAGAAALLQNVHWWFSAQILRDPQRAEKRKESAVQEDR